MKGKLFALIITASTLAGCSSGARLTRSSDGHIFQDGVYATRVDYAKQKAALVESQTASSRLIAETRRSDLYMTDGNGNLKTIPANAIIDSTSNQPPTILNFNISYDPYWGNYYDFTWRYRWGWGWYGDPFWYGPNWYWSGGPFFPWYFDPWFWDPWRMDPWFRPIYHYSPYYCYDPYYTGGGIVIHAGGRRVYGNHVTASVGGRHGMGGAGINGRTTPVGRSAGTESTMSRSASRSTKAGSSVTRSVAGGRTASAAVSSNSRSVVTVSPSSGRNSGSQTASSFRRADSNVRTAPSTSTRSAGSSYSGGRSAGSSYSGGRSAGSSYSGGPSASSSYSGGPSASSSYSGGRSSSGGHSGRR